MKTPTMKDPQAQADIIVKPDFRTLRRVVVTAITENAQKWLGGAGPFHYEVPEWKRAEAEASKTGFCIRRTV